MADGDGLIGKVKQKLIDTKQRWAGEGRLLTGKAVDPAAQRLPPGQREVKTWPVLDLGVQPAIDRRTWRLDIGGAVRNPQSWSWADFMGQTQQRFVSDIHCVTAWSRFDNRWDGVAARDVIRLIEPLPEARHVIFHGYDGYTTNVSLAAFDDDDVLIAHSWEGAPISAEHGGPVRIILPKLYLWKSAKWISRIELAADDRPGFWEVRGYHNNGDPWTEERYG